ncbi:hypothetical protein [Microbacterium aurum]
MIADDEPRDRRGLGGGERHRRDGGDRTDGEERGRGIRPAGAQCDGTLEADEGADEPEDEQRRVQVGEPVGEDRQRQAEQQEPRDESEHECRRGGEDQQQAGAGRHAGAGRCVHTTTLARGAETPAGQAVFIHPRPGPRAHPHALSKSARAVETFRRACRFR